MTKQEIEALCGHLETTAKLIAERFPNWAALNRTALTAIRQLQQPWRGMETCPKNGRFLLWCADLRYDHDEGTKLPVGTIFGNAFDGRISGQGFSGDWTFTAWMPLPTPPETGQ